MHTDAHGFFALKNPRFVRAVKLCGWTKFFGGRTVEAMKLRVSNHKTAALTLEEVVVSIIVLAVLAMLAIAIQPRRHDWRKTAWCFNNLKQVGLAYRIWEGDNNDKYPMLVSMPNGGSMESVAAGNVVRTFQVMSNELSTPKIVVCPQDLTRDYATNFTTDFNNSRISYFVNADADAKNPQAMLSGDANFEINGVAVKSGLLKISSNAPIIWSATRHKHSGNIALADGSVQSLNNSNQMIYFRQTGLATNRLAIP